jgi:hypothetical protein
MDSGLQGAAVKGVEGHAAEVDLSFPHRWQAEILAARPLILPPRYFVYPREAEEVERGALEVLVRPGARGESGLDEIRDFPPIRQKKGEWMGHPESLARPAKPLQDVRPFLATCALGFRDPIVPTGIWSAPNPDELCAVSGGYAYLIDTTAPERFTMIPYRPVLEIRPVVGQGLLLFVGHHAILAWGSGGQVWESEKLSDEGVTISGVEGGVLRGVGWEMRSDLEKVFALELRTGLPISAKQ